MSSTLRVDSTQNSISFHPDLIALDQWVTWRLETRDGKTTKVPYNPKTGRNADTTDPQTWSTFSVALSAWEAGRFDGVGFVFSDADPFAGVDLDHCRDATSGGIAPWAREIIAALDSYAELSPSGTGVHIFVRGRVPGARRKAKLPDGAVEMYHAGRFFTVTGQHLPGTPMTINERQDALDALYQQLFPDPQPHPNGRATPSGATTDLDDEQLLQLARSAKNGAKFVALYDQGDTSAYNDDESAADLALCCELAFWTGRDATRMDRLFRQSALYRPNWDERRGQTTYGALTIDRALALTTETYTRSMPVRVGRGQEDSDGRPLPEIDAGEQHLPTVTKAAWDALVQANDPPRYFRFAALPARIEEDERSRIFPRELGPDRMRNELARVARWVKVVEFEDEKTGKPVKFKVDAKPPLDVVRNVLAEPVIPLPVLDRIVEVPIFAPDGSLEQTPGYCPKSRVYFRPPAGLSIPTVPEVPTSADVKRALELVNDMIADFPFVSEADRANAIGLFVAPYAREIIDGFTPLHLIEAPSPGSGKGLLADVLLRPAIGPTPGLLTEAQDDDEWRKRITAALREAPSAILIDNIKLPLASGQLAAALTTPVWKDRLLGQSEMLRLPVRCLWVATANNPTVSDEIMRRTVPIRLDPKIDRPWLREDFQIPNLRAWVDAHRGELVWTGLVLVGNWLAKGRPAADVKPLGSYEQWSAVVGGILAAAEVTGFLGNLPTFYEHADARGAAWRALVTEWGAMYDARPVGVKELFEIAKEIDGFELAGKTEAAQKAAFGKELAKQRDRIIAGYQIAFVGKEKRASQWKLVKVVKEVKVSPLSSRARARGN